MKQSMPSSWKWATMNSKGIKWLLSLPDQQFIDKVLHLFRPEEMPPRIATRFARIFPKCERCGARIYELLMLPDHEFVDKVLHLFRPEEMPPRIATRLASIFPKCERCCAHIYEGRRIRGVSKCTCPDWEELNAWPNRPKPEHPAPHWFAPNEMTTHHRSPTYGERLAAGFTMMKGYPV